MNEAFIKNIIKYKLTAAGKILDRLPPEMSSNLKNLGRVILESINESSQEVKTHTAGEKKPADKLNNIKIE